MISENEKKVATKLAINRILVALNASNESLAAFDDALKLAASLQAEILGLFVEDINLVRLAALPFAREFTSSYAEQRLLNNLRMERALKAQAEELRRKVSKMANGMQVRWSFKVTRGHLLSEVLTAAGSVDLVIINKSETFLGKRPGLKPPLQYMVAQTTRSVVRFSEAATHRPVITMYDGTKPSEFALEAATRFAKSDAKNLVVIIPAQSREEAEKLQKQAAQWLQKEDQKARFIRVPDASIDHLLPVVENENGRLLVLNKNSPNIQDETVQTIIDQVKCPVVLVC